MEPLLQAHDAFNLVLLLIALLTFARIVGDKKNPLEFWHLFGTKAADGEYYVDNDRVGQIIGLVFGMWVVGECVYQGLMGQWTGVAIFAAWLIYASGMGAFAKWARAFISSRYGRDTERHEEPHAVTTTTTKTDTKVTP